MEERSHWLQWLEIDLDALTQNIKALRGHLRPGTKFMAVVKKNAYGCGAVAVSRAALKAGADYLAVHSLEEALEIREAGIHAPLLILGPVLPGAAESVVRQRLAITVTNRELACTLAAVSQKLDMETEAHVKVDTGLHRFGVSLEEAPGLMSYLATLSNLKVVGLYTHFSSADEPEVASTTLQLEHFLKLARLFPQVKLRHAANSAATLQFPKTHLGMVRVGLALYGLYPAAVLKRAVTLKPVLSFKTRVVRLHSIKAGTGVSYGLTWVAPRDSIVALIPVGYGHGLPRLLSNRGEVLLRGRRAPIRGVVCMDQSIVDVTDIPGVSVGEEVAIIGCQCGEEITAEGIAELANTINYEVVTRLPAALPRLYLGGKTGQG